MAATLDFFYTRREFDKLTAIVLLKSPNACLFFAKELFTASCSIKDLFMMIGTRSFEIISDRESCFGFLFIFFVAL